MKSSRDLRKTFEAAVEEALDEQRAFDAERERMLRRPTQPVIARGPGPYRVGGQGLLEADTRTAVSFLLQNECLPPTAILTKRRGWGYRTVQRLWLYSSEAYDLPRPSSSTDPRDPPSSSRVYRGIRAQGFNAQGVLFAMRGTHAEGSPRVRLDYFAPGSDIDNVVFVSKAQRDHAAETTRLRWQSTLAAFVGKVAGPGVEPPFTEGYLHDSFPREKSQIL